MSLPLPAHGELNWDTKLNAAINAKFEPTAIAASLDYTGVTDATSALQTILNTASAVAVAVGAYAVATVQLLPGALKITGLTLPAQVHLRGEATRLNAGGAGPVITTAGDFWHLSNLQFQGGGAGVGAAGIVVPTASGRGLIEQVRFDSFSGRAILCSAGSTACGITEVFAQNCLLTTAGLAAKTGVLELAGTDHHVFGNVELTASRATLSSASAYVCAVVVTGAANFLHGVLAEISDTGYYINASQTTMVGCRADLNMAHGFEFGGGGGVLSSCTALNNSQDTTNTYDGFNANAGNFILSGCMAQSTVAKVHRNGFRDTQASDANKNHYSLCRSLGHGTAGYNIANSGAAVTLPASPRVTVASGATPSVDGLTEILLGNSSATTVTNLTNGVPGQTVLVYGDGKSTLQHNGSTIILRGAVNIFMAVNVSIVLNNHSGTWREVGGAYEASGSAVLVGGTKAVTDSLITANSKIRLTNMTAGGTVGALSVALNAGTGFTINSSSGTDTSTIYYEIAAY